MTGENVIFQELGKVIGGIEENDASSDEQLFETITTIIALSDGARDNGLLALEDMAKQLEDTNLGRFVAYVVDGMEPETLFFMMMCRYKADRLKGTAGLKYLLNMVGALSIQEGEHPLVTEEKLKMMLPSRIARRYEEHQQDHLPRKVQYRMEDRQ